MSPVREMIVQDVRCFQGTQRGRLRPITLLVGENSTGKSTFLACYRVLSELVASSIRLGGADLDFNREPFFLGSFRDIVRLRRGPQGRIDQFSLAMVVEASANQPLPFEMCVRFSEKGSEPVVSSFHWDFGDGEFLELRRADDQTTIGRVPGCEGGSDSPFDVLPYGLDVLFMHDGRGTGPWQPIADYVDRQFPRERGVLDALAESMLPPRTNLVPIAPLRSKPQRTYDPVRETASSDGQHVPMLMMRLDRTDKPRWDSLHDDLVAFGRESGLFSDFQVKRHGRQMSDPFQLRVKVRTGPSANLMDVGYGVSQSLPILVDIMAPGQMLLGTPTFLLQQPEVHLHPRGQAELASLFVQSFKKRGHHFLVETHSDYIVDRVRICVRQEFLRPDDVSILYFEPRGNAVTIHNLTLDRHGNLNDAPPGYRDFFSRETDRLLGFAD